MIIIETALFILFSMLFFLIPGYAVFKNLYQDKSNITLFLSFITGICVFILLTFIIRLLQLPFLCLYFYIIFDIWYLIKSKKVLKEIFTKFDIFSLIILLIIFIVSGILVVGHLRSGEANGYLHLASARDTLWRLSIITELINRFPPQTPGFPPILLKNYHYFYDLLIAATAKITNINQINLYIHEFALLSAVLFTLSIYSIFRFFKLNKVFSTLGALLTIFTGNLSFVLPLLSKQYNFFAKSNIFMSDQPFDQSHNPFNLLAYALFIGLIILIISWEKNTKFKSFFLISLILGILCGIKIYAGILICIGLAILLAIKVSQKKFKLYYLLPSVFVLPVINVIKGDNFSILSFNPGWLLTKMIEDQDRLFLKDMALKIQYYQNTGNMIRLWQYRIIQLLIYFIGNLNVRIFAVGIFINKIWKKYLQKESFLFVLSIIIAAFLIPLLFNQTRASYDSIQFTPYGVLLCSILLILPVRYLYEKYSKKIAIIIFFILFGLSLPTNIPLIKDNIDGASYSISIEEVVALSYIKSISKPDAIILSDTDMDKMMHMYVSVLSQRQIFLSGTALVEQTGIDASQRLKRIENFFIYDYEKRQPDKAAKIYFLKINNIKYIYLSKSGLAYKKLMDILGLPLIYNNDQALIYEVV